VLALVGIVPATDAAVTIVNRIVTVFVRPGAIPALELKGGVPLGLRTIVVMPTLLTTPAEIEEHAERLEVHYLANPDGELHFALLSDWCDSPTETAINDDQLLGAAMDRDRAPQHSS